MKIAQFDKRVFSWLIDLAISFLISHLLVALISKISDFTAYWYFYIVSWLILTWLVYTIFVGLFMYFSNGLTIGSLIFKTRVVHRDNSKITLKDAFCKCISVSIVVFCVINAIYMLMVHTEISIFDTLTNTIVINNSKD